MTDTSTAMKFIIGFGAILAVGIPTFVVGQYVSDLRHDMEASKIEVEHLKGQITSLQDILQKTQSAQQTAKGEKGDRGEVGPMGPRGLQGVPGDNGPMGPSGPSTGSSGMSEEAVRTIIATELAKRLAAMPLASGTPNGTPAIAAAISVFDTSGCVPWESIKNLEVVTLKLGTEVCAADGRLMGTVQKIYDDGQIYMSVPGQKNDRCNLNQQCDWPMLGNQQYVYERVAGIGTDRTAMLRRTAKR